MSDQAVAHKRRWTRKQTRIGARIFALGGFMRLGADVGCAIVNLSEGGALIETPDAEAIPDDFYLVIDAIPERKIVCAVAHRSSTRLGVSFSVFLPQNVVRAVGEQQH